MLGRRSLRGLLASLGLCGLFLALTFSFVSNGFGVAPWNEWAVWEKGSEAMVLQRIEFDLLNRESSAFGLGQFTIAEDEVFDRLAADSIDPERVPDTFEAYTSEIGGQAYFWSFIWRGVGCNSVGCLHLVNSMLFALAVIAMFVGITTTISRGLGAAWLLSAALSPWFVFAARNLFWSPWLYFVPTIAALLLVRAQTRKAKWWALLVVFVAFLVKFIGSGYHEFTAVLLLAASMPVLFAAFTEKKTDRWSRALKDAMAVGSAGVVAIFSVIVFHAYLLSGNVIVGINRLWTETVLRRTYGSNLTNNVYAEASAASPLDVLWRYVWSEWWTDLLKISVDASGSLVSLSLGSRAFVVLSLGSFLVVLLRLGSLDFRWKRDLIVLVAGFLIAAVWFIAAKSYSYIHWYVLFFLWYFLYVPAIIYVVGSYAREWFKLMRRAAAPRTSESNLEVGKVPMLEGTRKFELGEGQNHDD